MGKILILYNFFNYNQKYVPRIVKKFLNAYSNIRLNNFIKNLNQQRNKNLKIEVINAQNEKLKLNKDIGYKRFSDLRLSFKRLNFIKIKKKVVANTRKILSILFKNLRNLKIYNIDGIFIPRLLEYKYVYYFNTFFGQIELLFNHIKKVKYDEIIFFNCNPFSINFLQSTNFYNSKLFRFNDKFYLFSQKLLCRLNLIIYILILLGSYIKQKFKRKQDYHKLKGNVSKKNVLFLVHTKNQFNSLNPVYKYLKYNQTINPHYYFIEYFVRFSNFPKLLKFLLQKRKIVRENHRNISRNLKYYGNNLIGFLKFIYKSHFFPDLIEIFNFLNNLKRFLRDDFPDLLIVANDFNVPERTILNYFHLKGIKILYIPHAAIPILDEFLIKSNIDFFALGGEVDKAYYLKKGIKSQNIFISGIPRYEKFYKNKIDRLKQIKDMFNEKIYEFNNKKLSILLTTNPIDDKSNENIIKSVVTSLKELNLIENLIIKLHPSESGTLHKKVINQLNVDPLIVKNYNILELISSCDLLISQKSTTLLEAMIIGTPMILLDFINKGFEESSRYEFLNERFIDTVKNQDSLTQEIKKVIDYKYKKENLRDKYIKYSKQFSFYDPIEPPTEKIVNYILKLIKKKSL